MANMNTNEQVIVDHNTSDLNVSDNLKEYNKWQLELATANVEENNHTFSSYDFGEDSELDCVLQSCTINYVEECGIFCDEDNGDKQPEEKQNITDADSDHLNSRSTKDWAAIRPLTIRCPHYIKANALGGIKVVVNSRLNNGVYMDSFLLDNNGNHVAYNSRIGTLGTHSGDIHRRGWLIHSILLNTPDKSVDFYLAIAGWKNRKPVPISSLKGLPRVVEYQITEIEDGKEDKHKIVVDQNFTDSKNTGKSTMIVARINYNIDNKEWTIRAVEEMVDGFADDIPTVLKSIKEADTERKEVEAKVEDNQQVDLPPAYDAGAEVEAKVEDKQQADLPPVYNIEAHKQFVEVV